MCQVQNILLNYFFPIKRRYIWKNCRGKVWKLPPSQLFYVDLMQFSMTRLYNSHRHCDTTDVFGHSPPPADSGSLPFIVRCYSLLLVTPEQYLPAWQALKPYLQLPARLSGCMYPIPFKTYVPRMELIFSGHFKSSISYCLMVSLSIQIANPKTGVLTPNPLWAVLEMSLLQSLLSIPADAISAQVLMTST